MTRKYGLTAICLVMLLLGGALPALAQPDRHDEQDEAASPAALAQYRKGERLAKEGQFTEAVAAYRQAIRLEPDYPQAYYEMGLAYAGLNQYPDAVKAFKEAARLQPEMGLIYENLGVVYIKMGQWREARDALAEAIRLHPDSPEAHYNLGLANGKLTRDQEARAQFAEAVRLAPDMAKAHKNLGLAYLNLGQLDASPEILAGSGAAGPQRCPGPLRPVRLLCQDRRRPGRQPGIPGPETVGPEPG